MNSIFGVHKEIIEKGFKTGSLTQGNLTPKDTGSYPEWSFASVPYM
jgi:hypothetical protein